MGLGVAARAASSATRSMSGEIMQLSAAERANWAAMRFAIANVSLGTLRRTGDIVVPYSMNPELRAEKFCDIVEQ
jgi:hypothetical protein